MLKGRALIFYFAQSLFHQEGFAVMMNKIRDFMAGRNALDALGVVCLGAALLLQFTARITDWSVLSLPAIALLGLTAFRMLSKNLARRQAENYAFLNIVPRIRSAFDGWRVRRQQSKEYRFFTCPGCKNHLRVPRGKGKLQITCPRCGQRFSGKT